MENDFTVSCHVSQIRCKFSLRSKEAYGFLYKEITKEIDAEQVLVIQLVPHDWPQRMKVTLRSKEVKEELLIRGLQLYDNNVVMKDEDNSITKVTLQNLSASIKDEAILAELSKYGVALRVEHEFIYAEGYKTSAVTGTRFVYMASIATRIPSNLEITQDSISSIAKVLYRAKQPLAQAGDSDNTPGNAPVKRDRACYACGKSDHISSECPDNKGYQQTDDVFLLYSSKSPLHVMNTEYPFRYGEREYICVEQFFNEAKCLHFGDRRLASQVCDEVDPKIMRRIGERIPGYRNSEWLPHAPRILGEAFIAKFGDKRATGAREALLDTGERLIAEASRNAKYGTGIHISDANAFDKSKWEGENIIGQLLMLAREQLLEEISANTEKDTGAETGADGETGEEEEGETDDEESADTSISDGSISDHELNISAMSIAEEGSPQAAGVSPERREVIVIGDKNITDLQLSAIQSDSDNNAPFCVTSFCTDDKSVESVSRGINEGSIACDIDDKGVAIVALHVGAFEWHAEAETPPTAASVFSAYQRLLNAVCLRFTDPQIVISGVPLQHPCDNPTEKGDAINTEITKLNAMLYALNTEGGIHFVNNDTSSLYINSTFESLYQNHRELNEKGKAILADNLRGGISVAATFAQNMSKLGLPEFTRVAKRRSASPSPSS